MENLRYIKVRELCHFYEVEYEIIEAFHESGLIELEVRAPENDLWIAEEFLEQLEIMIRLHHELDVNIAGIETILHMRSKMIAMQKQMEEMERHLDYYKVKIERLDQFQDD